MQLQKITYGLADQDQQPDTVIRAEILSLVRRLMPASIYYCVSGQITIWLISVFGNTSTVAEIGALGRLIMLLSLFTGIIATLVVPRFAKLASHKNILMKRFIQIMGLMFFLLSAIVLLIYLFPTPILWLLGDKYKGLPFELFLSSIGSCIGIMAGIAYGLFTSRGWSMQPFIAISVNLLTVIVLVSILDLSSLKGALLLNIGVSGIALIQTSLYCVYKILKIKR
jgi:O-antigen/teichoic acid export membrane protein